jgi:hypothetical protein
MSELSCLKFQRDALRTELEAARKELAGTTDKGYLNYLKYNPSPTKTYIEWLRTGMEYLEEATIAAATGKNPHEYLATKAPTTLRDELAALREWKEELGKRLNTCPEHILDIISDWEDTLDELEELREQARQCPPHNWTEWTDTENLKNGFPVCKKCGVIWGCSDNSQDDVINFFRDLEEGEGIRPLPLPPAPAEGGEG